MEVEENEARGRVKCGEAIHAYRAAFCNAVFKKLAFTPCCSTAILARVGAQLRETHRVVQSRCLYIGVDIEGGGEI